MQTQANQKTTHDDELQLSETEFVQIEEDKDDKASASTLGGSENEKKSVN